MVQQGLDHLVEIGPVGGIDLGGDLQRHAERLGDGDGAVGALFGGDAAEEGEVAALALATAIQARLQPVQHRARPVGPGHGPALAVGDGHQWELRPAAVDARQVLQVEPAVERGQGALGHVLEEGEVDHIGVEVDEIELVRPPPHLVQHGHVRGEVRLQQRRIQPDRLVARGNQPGLGLGLGAGEQGHLMAQFDKGIGQVGHHPLRAAIQLRRDRLVQRRDLSNLHFSCLAEGRVRAPFPQSCKA